MQDTTQPPICHTDLLIRIVLAYIVGRERPKSSYIISSILPTSIK